MGSRFPLVLAGAVALALTLSACGGGDGDPPSPQQTAIGTITAFGSVVVNGIRFDDASAAVTMDGDVASRDRLRVGMVVQVRGRIHADGTGVASTIRYDDCVQGPVTAMNQVQNTLTVMGQTVTVDDETVFDGVAQRDMNAFAIGDLVAVSCLHDPSARRLRATRMERQGVFRNGVSRLGLTGTVSNLDRAAGTCRIGGLTVNFAGVAAADRPSGLANGMQLEVAGTAFANGVLTAQRLRDRDQDRIHFTDGDGLELEGYVSGFVSIADFQVAGQAVDASNAVIRNGAAADVRDGVKVEVEGTVQDGVLLASRLVLKLRTDVRVEAGVQATDAAAGTIRMLGRTIRTTADTELRDRLDDAGQPRAITLGALRVADRLQVNAYRNGAGNLVATRIERTEADTLVVVKGPADAKLPVTQLTLAGFAVASGAATRYRDADGTLVDAATFFAAVRVPPPAATVVHARGVVATLATNVVDATRTLATTGELRIGGD